MRPGRQLTTRALITFTVAALLLVFFTAAALGVTQHAGPWTIFAFDDRVQNGTTNDKHVSISGSSNIFHGDIKSNGDYDASGSSNVFNGIVRYHHVNVPGSNTYAAPLPNPAQEAFASTYPGTLAAFVVPTCTSGDFTTDTDLVLNASSANGTYCRRNGNIGISDSNVTKSFTLLTQPNEAGRGLIEISGQNVTLTPFADGVLAWTTSTSDSAIEWSGSNGNGTGLFFAPNGRIDIEGSNSVFCMQFAATFVTVQGSTNTFNECVFTDTTTTDATTTTTTTTTSVQTTTTTEATTTTTSAQTTTTTEATTTTGFDVPECQKQTVRDVLNLTYPGNFGPDATVLTYLGQSVQAAVDAATDSNGDGYIIVMVIAHADGSLGGTSNQKVVVDADYGNDEPFALFGCSVTLTGGGNDPAVWVKPSANSKNIAVNGRTTDIFVMDLHGASSAVGVFAEGSYRYLRNEYGTGNGTGIKVVGNYNTVHNGAAADNSADGVSVSGNYNKLTDTNAMNNGGHGFSVAGNSNQLLKLDAGERGTPNTLDGVHLVGNSNTLSEIDAYANLGDGIDVAGSSNTLTKNVAGDRNKGNGGDGYLIVGASNTLTENRASANTGDGFDISGALTSATANKLKNNLSNTGASGSDLENGPEWRFLNWIKNNGGGNRADGVLLANGVKGLTNFPASGSSFNYTVVQTAE